MGLKLQIMRRLQMNLACSTLLLAVVWLQKSRMKVGTWILTCNEYHKSDGGKEDHPAKSSSSHDSISNDAQFPIIVPIVTNATLYLLPHNIK